MTAPATAIYSRLFQALDYLKETQQITGISNFCEQYGLNKTKYSKVRNNYQSAEGKTYKTLDIEALYFLAKDFNISLEWLFFGVGGMVKNIKAQIRDAEIQS